MEKVKKVIDKFLQPYINEEYFLGAILTGSYATGNNHEKSDIDIFIVTKDSTSWRERGNRQIDGYMVEYFINPVRQVMKEFNEGFMTNNIATTLIFAGSIVLYDTDSTVAALVAKAKEDLHRPLAPVSAFRWNMNCYTVWHSFHELTVKYEEGTDIDFTYSIFLENIISAYFTNCGIPMVSLHKIERILMDEEYRKRYNALRMPRKDFCEKLAACFKAKGREDRYTRAKEMYEYYMVQNKDFDINSFSFRSDV